MKKSTNNGSPTGINPREWMKEVEHLPDFLRDFHNQKDFFKTIDETFKKCPELESHTWVSNHIYTLDYFLWFCGIHGYTMQKSRKKGIAFEDIQEKLKESRGTRLSALPRLPESASKESKVLSEEITKEIGASFLRLSDKMREVMKENEGWTFYLSAMPPVGQKRQDLCDYCWEPKSKHREDLRCPIKGCTLSGPP